MSDASDDRFEVTFSVRAATREAAQRVVAAAMDAAIEPKKERKMRDSSGKGSLGVPAPHEPVNASRGTKIPDADLRDTRNPRDDQNGKRA